MYQQSDSKLTNKKGLQNGRIKREKRAAYITIWGEGLTPGEPRLNPAQISIEGISREREGPYSTRANRKEGNCRMDHSGFIEAVRKRREIAIAAWIPGPL